VAFVKEDCVANKTKTKTKEAMTVDVKKAVITEVDKPVCPKCKQPMLL
jgi:hypothetical protein